METINNGNQHLSPFLRNLADSIENEELSTEQMERIGEFYMSYQFKEQVKIDISEENNEISDFNEEDLMKFIIMGWYIYVCMLKDKSIT